MSYVPIVPAELSFAGAGTPFSQTYDDVYHSAAGGLEQARHVFLAGNKLPLRWQERNFVILEIGFGLGLNFLATWQAWLKCPGRRLHYVALEIHPFSVADLAQLHDEWPELAPLAQQLHQHWPLPLPGLHRLDFGNVVLTLGFGNALDLLPQLSLAAEAIYLDGFKPEKNSEPWSEAVIAQLRRLAAPGATLTTWTIAGELRRRLASADFCAEKQPGFGFKRDMLFATLSDAEKSAPTTSKGQRRIIVIGAGLAGASVAHALAKRGHAVVVLDAAAMPAAGASGNRAGVFRPLPSIDDSRLARLLRAGFLFGQRQISTLSAVRCNWTGVLHIARDAKHEDTQRRIVTEHALPPEFCRFVTRTEATALAGWPVEMGGWWFSSAGWVDPASLCRTLLAGIECHFDFTVTHLERKAAYWHIAGSNNALNADSIVLANGVGAPMLAPGYPLPIRAGRGQVSHLPESVTPRFDSVVTRLGYVTPVIDGIRCAGATLQANDRDPALRLADHIENLHRLDMALPGFGKGIDPATLDGRVSFRPMSPDRLPIVGPLAASEDLWIIDGFGARGLVFAAICAEVLASQIGDEPLPLEADLVAAIAPARFNRQGKV